MTILHVYLIIIACLVVSLCIYRKVESAVQIFSLPRNSNSHVQTTVLRSCARYFWHTCVVFTQLRTCYTSSIVCDIHQGVLWKPHASPGRQIVAQRNNKMYKRMMQMRFFPSKIKKIKSKFWTFIKCISMMDWSH